MHRHNIIFNEQISWRGLSFNYFVYSKPEYKYNPSLEIK